MQRAGREYISLLAAARTPHKVAISDGLAGHRRLQLDCHVLAQFGEIPSYASSALSNEKDPQYFHAQNPVAAAGDVWYYQKKRAERKNRKSVLGRLKDRVLRFIW